MVMAETHSTLSRYQPALLASVTMRSAVAALAAFTFKAMHQSLIAVFSSMTVGGFRRGSGSSIVCREPTGWGATYACKLTAPWYLPNPIILGNAYGLGVQSNQFGFTISWATNISVVVQASTNLSNPVWTPLATNALVDGTNYFSDPGLDGYPRRLYRSTTP